MQQDKTLLIVDDSPLSRKIISAIVRKNFPSWKILEAGDGQQALSLNEPVIDMMTLDINMPGLDGISLGHELKQRYPAALISLVSANTQAEQRQKADIEGFRFVAKPISEGKIMSIFRDTETN